MISCTLTRYLADASIERKQSEHTVERKEAVALVAAVVVCIILYNNSHQPVPWLSVPEAISPFLLLLLVLPLLRLPIYIYIYDIIISLFFLLYCTTNSFSS